MSGSPLNGGRPQLPPMSPDERALWLASHNAPENLRLLTTGELAIMRSNLQRAAVYEAEFRETIGHLDRWGYWEPFPDVKTAAANAAFDARRYQRATIAAIERLEKTLALMDLLLQRPEIGPVLMIDTISERNGVLAALTFLKAQDAARVEMKPKEKR